MTAIPVPPPAADQPALLTPTTLATLGGMTTAVLVVVNGIHAATGWTSAWFGLVLSLALALAVEFMLGQATAGRTAGARAMLALFNGFLIFTTALGGNQLGARATATTETNAPIIQPRSSILPPPVLPPAPAPDRAFFHDWLE